jgi:hypothetical protein
MKKKTCLILEWIKLPTSIKDKIKNWHNFHNDCIITLNSEFSAKDLCKGMTAIEEYWRDQNYDGTLQAFIKKYNLDFEVWIIEQNFDLSDIDEILIDICW